MSKALKVAVGLLALAGLAGCGGNGVGQSLMGKRVPDEFQVVRRAPLVLPPDYALRPPEPGAAPAAQQDTAAQAQELLTGQRPAAAAAPRAPTAQSPGEVALVDQSRVQGNPDIRRVLVAENQDLVNLDEGRFLFILNFQRRAAQRRQEPVIDPVAEQRRLASAGATGSVVTQRTGSEPLVQ